MTDTSCTTIDPVRLPLVRPTSAVNPVMAGGCPVEINAEYALKFLKSASAKVTANVSMGAQAPVANTSMKNHVTSSKQPKAQQTKPHYFSLPFAREHGVAEAIVLRFLAFKVRRSRNVRDGKAWFFDPIRELAKRYPYIPKSTMADILRRLEAKGLVSVGNYNKRRGDRTGWYTVPQPVMDAVEKGKLLRIDQDAAEILGVPAGVLMAHIRYELLKKPRKGKRLKAWPYVSISPAALAELLPFSAKTIQRTLDKLSLGGLIVEHPDKGLLFTLPELLNVAGTYPDRQWTEPDKKRTNPDAKWTDPDNYTHYKPLETIGRPFKENTPASPAVVGERSDDRNQETITYEKLKGINKGNSFLFEFKDSKLCQWDQPADDPGMRAVSLVVNLSWSFVRSLSDDTLYDLQSITDMDQLAAKVNALFTAHFESTQPAHSKLLKNVLFHASLEVVVNAIACFRDKDTYCNHSIGNLACHIYDLHLEMFTRLDADSAKAWQRWMEDRRKQFASVDEAKEPDSDLAPAEKARVLRNALQARNVWGYFDDYGEYVKEGRYIFNQPDLDLAEKLFELNRGFCVSQLLGLIDQCAEICLRNDVPEGHDKHFHARRGNALGFFLNHAPKIAEELGSAALNGWEPLAEDVKLKDGEDESTEPATR